MPLNITVELEIRQSINGVIANAAEHSKISADNNLTVLYIISGD